MNINNLSPLQEEYDAIVIGTGISGGWAAKELCENGLKTLVLERGPMVRHITDYPTMNLDPWDMELRGTTSLEDKKSSDDALFKNKILQRIMTLAYYHNWDMKKDEKSIV